MTSTTGSQRTIGLPPVYCPLEPARHPESEAINERVISWLVSTGVRPQGAWFQKLNALKFTCYCYPFTTDERAEAITYLMYLLGAWDDDLETTPDRREPARLACETAQLVRCFERPELGAGRHSPYERAMADFRRALNPHMTRVQYGWFLEELRRYFGATLWKNIIDARQEFLSLSDYLLMRMADVAGLWMTALVPIAGGYDLPAQWVHDPQVRALTESTAVLLGLDNDMCSYDREVLQGNFGQHPYDILMHRDSLTLSEAAAATTAIRDRIMTLHMNLRARILASSPPEPVARFVATVGYIVRGGIEWAATTFRYTHPQDPRTGAEVPFGDHQLSWASQPCDPRTDPPDIASIAWWWSV
jgi:hypothetical protein